MMTSAKGPTYIQSYFLPNLLQIEQILNKLEKGLQWLPKPNLFDLKKTPTFAGSLSWQVWKETE